MIFSRRGAARRGAAGPGGAWHGNTSPSTATGTIFQGQQSPGLVRRRWAGQGDAWRGSVWQHACRWAVSPDTFGKQKQGN